MGADACWPELLEEMCDLWEVKAMAGGGDFEGRTLTVLRHLACSPLQQQADPPAARLDQLDGPSVGHVSRALAVDLDDLVADLGVRQRGGGGERGKVRSVGHEVSQRNRDQTTRRIHLLKRPSGVVSGSCSTTSCGCIVAEIMVYTAVRKRDDCDLKCDSQRIFVVQIRH